MSDERIVGAVDREIGARVRARRLEIGMSQERLAELLGVTFQQVQKYEKGANRIAAGRLFDLSSALDMPISRFFEGLPARGAVAGAGRCNDSIDAAVSSPREAQILALFASIRSVKARRRLVELMRALTKG